MTTKPDFDQLRELSEVYTPAQRGILSPAEETLIRDTLEITQRTDIELQNIRNATVAIYGEMYGARLDPKMDNIKAQLQRIDAVSAITAAIDQEKINRGLPV